MHKSYEARTTRTKLKENFIIKYKFLICNGLLIARFKIRVYIQRIDNDKIVVVNHKKEVVATILNLHIKRNNNRYF